MVVPQFFKCAKAEALCFGQMKENKKWDRDIFGGVACGDSQ